MREHTHGIARASSRAAASRERDERDSRIPWCTAVMIELPPRAPLLAHVGRREPASEQHHALTAVTIRHGPGHAARGLRRTSAARWRRVIARPARLARRPGVLLSRAPYTCLTASRRLPGRSQRHSRRRPRSVYRPGLGVQHRWYLIAVHCDPHSRQPAGTETVGGMKLLGLRGHTMCHSSGRCSVVIVRK